MKIKFLFLAGMLVFAFADICFAGSVSPMKGSLKVDPDELCSMFPDSPECSLATAQNGICGTHVKTPGCKTTVEICGEFPYSPDCVTCDNIAQPVPKDCALCDAAVVKYRTDSDNYVKCTDKVVNDYAQPSLDKMEREDQTAAAQNQLDEDIKGCQNTSAAQFAQCKADVISKYDKKIALIGQNNWTELKKILDQEDKLAQQKRVADEKKLLDDAKSKDPGITTISNGGGNVAISRADGTWGEVYAKTDIKDGDLVKVGSGGANINYSDGSIIDVGPNSTFRYHDAKLLTELNLGINGIVKEIDLLEGKIKAFGHKFEVRTSNAILADRGTNFVVAYDAAAKITNVYLNEGQVGVDNLHGKIAEMQPQDTISISDSGLMTMGKLGQGEWERLAGQTAAAKTETQTVETGSITLVDPPVSPLLWAGIPLILLIGAVGFKYSRMRKSRK